MIFYPKGNEDIRISMDTGSAIILRGTRYDNANACVLFVGEDDLVWCMRCPDGSLPGLVRTAVEDIDLPSHLA